MDDARLLSWVERAQIISAFLVAIGVVGEFLGDWISGPIRRRMESARELEIATANERTASAELALAELRHRIEPRRLSDTQILALLEGLKKASPKGSVSISCVLGDGEGNSFATQISALLKEAGWPDPGVDQAVYVGGNPVGFGIVVHSAKKPPDHAIALLKAFRDANVPIEATERGDVPSDGVRIIVGVKPQ